MNRSFTMRHSHRQLLTQLSTAIVVLDQALNLVFVNPAAETALSLSSQQCLGASATDVLGPEAAHIASLDDDLGSGQSFTKREAELHPRGGTPMIVDYTVSALNDDAERELLVEFQPLDRLLKINREDQHVASQQTIKELVRGMAHEVKNPLGGIRGAAQLLERELPGDQLKDYTRVIIDEADRLKRLVDRMLGPNRPNQFQPVNIYRVLEHVRQLVESSDGGDAITFTRDYDPSVPPVPGDSAQLIQAFLNVFSNAAEALSTTDDAHIDVRTRVVSKFNIGFTRHRLALQIEVRDNGPGVDPEIQERMFFPMITGKPTGSGLGLAITQTIIGQHNGVIEVTSEPGDTCFTIYLPLDHSGTGNDAQ